VREGAPGKEGEEEWEKEEGEGEWEGAPCVEWGWRWVGHATRCIGASTSLRSV